MEEHIESKNEEQKKDNPDLYEQDWPKDADNQTYEAQLKSCKKHKFSPTKKANEVKCECGVGYILMGNLKLRTDGHIYHEEQFVI